MTTATSIPDHIRSRVEYKRHFGLLELYGAFVQTPIAVAKIIKNRRKKLVDKAFLERLMLAVTEVNGCTVCSYAHSYVALKQGMSNEEINSFLSGDEKFIDPVEAKAIAFAQHFADTRGFPKNDAYKTIIDEYGKEKAEIILSAIQLIMVGNMYGIPYSAFKSRLKGKPYKDSSLIYELGMLIAGLILLPISLIHGVLRALLGVSNIRFGKGTIE